MKGVNIQRVPTLGGGIAKVNIDTGVITVAEDRFFKFPSAIRTFVLLHELGHYVLQTDNELEVDRWALRQFIKRGYSPKMAVYALSRVLNFSNPEHEKRLFHQLDRARHYDFHINGNLTALNPQKNGNRLIRSYTGAARQ